MQNLSKTFIKYLSAKENNEFGNEKFLNLLDVLEMQENTNFVSFLEDFKKDFNAYSQISNELNVILEEEKKSRRIKRTS